ncbi:SPOR domain-containing protein [Agilicoccus flavus]|uniref:SPOR domain-containing protein n=1 Tax=Agilicoccus flavus TaxID=2775968 RepID=UPI001CF6F115|nr:SPOR domain-containing protein [Agilicoccus flavus]
MPYWYNVSTEQVEEDSNTSRKDNLMGPYATHDEAARALQTAAEKTRRWDEETAAEQDD